MTPVRVEISEQGTIARFVDRRRPRRKSEAMGVIYWGGGGL
jgi:hypothetical protein